MSIGTAEFLSRIAPYDRFDPDELQRTALRFQQLTVAKDDTVYTHGEPAQGLYVILDGTIRVLEASGSLLSHLHSGNSFGERGLLKNGHAVTTAIAESDATLLLLPPEDFAALRQTNADFLR